MDKINLELEAKGTVEMTCEGCFFDRPESFSCDIQYIFPCMEHIREDKRNIIWVQTNSR